MHTLFLWCPNPHAPLYFCLYWATFIFKSVNIYNHRGIKLLMYKIYTKTLPPQSFQSLQCVPTSLVSSNQWSLRDPPFNTDRLKWIRPHLMPLSLFDLPQKLRFQINSRNIFRRKQFKAENCLIVTFT